MTHDNDTGLIDCLLSRPPVRPASVDDEEREQERDHIRALVEAQGSTLVELLDRVDDQRMKTGRYWL
jgi:hypothetical protein